MTSSLSEPVFHAQQAQMQQGVRYRCQKIKGSRNLAIKNLIVTILFKHVWASKFAFTPSYLKESMNNSIGIGRPTTIPSFEIGYSRNQDWANEINEVQFQTKLRIKIVTLVLDDKGNNKNNIKAISAWCSICCELKLLYQKIRVGTQIETQ